MKATYNDFKTYIYTNNIDFSTHCKYYVDNRNMATRQLCAKGEEILIKRPITILSNAKYHG